MSERQTRRAFVGSMLAVTAAAAAATSTVSIACGTAPEAPAAAESRSNAAPRKRRRLTPEQFKDQLEGPIQSQPSPFNAELQVDHEAIARMIARAQRYGVKCFELTAGNSQYHALSFDEICAITRTMTDAASEDSLVIAAAGDWWTALVVDYARFAEAVGADAVQVMLPSRADSEAATVEHFRAITSATKLPIVLHGVYPESLLNKILPFPSIVGMKEDAELTYYIDREITFGKRLNIFSGGEETRFLVGQPYGARAFFSTYTSFAPDISMKFWQAIKSGDTKAAIQITEKYDHPFIKRFSHPFWHATLEHFGVAKRFMRPPQTSFTDEQMVDVKKFFDGQGLSPASYQ